MVGRALALTLLLAMPGASADWLQAGGDGPGTGESNDEAALWGDLAFRLDRADFAPYDDEPPEGADDDQVLLVAGVIYTTRSDPRQGLLETQDLPVYPGTYEQVPRVPFGVFAIPLDDPIPRLIGNGTTSQAFDISMASDGDLLFVAGDFEVQAIPLHAGMKGWTASVPQPDPTLARVSEAAPIYPARVAPQTSCPRMALDGARLVLACVYDGGGYLPFLVSFDPGTGQATKPYLVPYRASSNANSVPATPEAAGVTKLQGLALQGDVAAVTTTLSQYVVPEPVADSPAKCARLSGGRMVAVDLGAELDQSGLARVLREEGSQYGICADLRPDSGDYHWFSPPLLAQGEVLFKDYYLNGCSLTTEDVCRYTESIASKAAQDHDDGAGLALRGDSVFVAAGARLFRLTAPGFLTEWTSTLPQGLAWGPGNLFLAGSQVLGVTCGNTLPIRSGVASFDVESGNLLWTSELGSYYRCPRLAVGSDVVVARTDEGLTVLGLTPASIQPHVASTTVYPKLGDMVRVDLSGSEAGRSGAPTEYLAAWGDGTAGDWQASPVLEHRYTDAADHTARFTLRNAAGETASTTLVFHVDRHDPAVTIWNSPLDDEYQNTTFFVIGLLATALAGLFGIMRAGRKRRLLEHELRQLQALVVEFGDDADGLQDRLVERRQHAHLLYMRRQLEDGHLQVLEKRIDEYAGRARLGRIEEECGFLPYALGRSLEAMLRDGRISSRERTTFLAAIGTQPGLTEPQKDKVRALIAEWFAKDSAPIT